MYEFLSNCWFLVVIAIAAVTLPTISKREASRFERRRLEAERRAGGLILID